MPFSWQVLSRCMFSGRDTNSRVSVCSSVCSYWKPGQEVEALEDKVSALGWSIICFKLFASLIYINLKVSFLFFSLISDRWLFDLFCLCWIWGKNWKLTVTSLYQPLPWSWVCLLLLWLPWAVWPRVPDHQFHRTNSYNLHQITPFSLRTDLFVGSWWMTYRLSKTSRHSETW